MKRLWFFDLLLVGLVLLGGLGWSRRDQIEHADTLDHFGLSHHTLVVRPTKGESVQAVATRLQNSELTGGQVQFQTAKKQPIYLWARQTPPNLPLSSGQWFSEAALQADLPVAVVGSAVQPLREAADQTYWRFDGQFVPVIGTMGTRETSNLTSAVVINATANLASRQKVTDTTILVDGDNREAIAEQLTRWLHGKSVHRYRYASTSNTKQRRQQNRWLSVMLSTLLLAAMAVAFLMSWWIQPTLPRELDHALQNRYRRGRVGQLSAHSAAAISVGGVLAWWRLYLTSPGRFSLYTVSLWVSFVLAAMVAMRWRYRNAKGN